MRDPDQFDAFYSGARQRLLLQTYALTGDLPAARSAVRDAFVSAWHRWHKVSRQDDPEAWVRPYAWQHAQTKHRTHFWHRDRSLAADHRATLEALAQLPTVQRRALLLHALAGLPVTTLAGELGLSASHADRQLRLAIAQFAIHREVTPQEVAAPLLRLAERTDDVRLPRSTIVRRTGTTRRRAHTTAGVALAAAALLASGVVVGSSAGVTPTLAGERGGTVPDRRQPVPHLTTKDLLPSSALGGLAPRARIRETTTSDNTRGTGRNLPCQSSRFADPKVLAALVRNHVATGTPATSVVQVVERSAGDVAARVAYDTTLEWFADCRDRRIQLLTSHRVTGAGDEGAVLVLRDWDQPITTYTVGVVRTGTIVTSVARKVVGRRDDKLAPFLAVLGSASAELCEADGGGTCPTKPVATPAPPPRGPSVQGLLQAVDLPPVKGAPSPWVGTEPERATTNPAATPCDRSEFTDPAISWSATRTFLLPKATKLPTRFGLSETVGRFAGAKSATAFVTAATKRMDTCEDRDLSATVRRLAVSRTPHTSVASWKLTAKVGQDSSVVYYVALVRRGTVVAQVGFVPASDDDITPAAFEAVATRALDRLANLPPR